MSRVDDVMEKVAFLVVGLLHDENFPCHYSHFSSFFFLLVCLSSSRSFICRLIISESPTFQNHQERKLEENWITEQKKNILHIQRRVARRDLV